MAQSLAGADMTCDDSNVDSNPKRDAIMDAASRLFLERGYAGTSMDAIAEAAPVSKPTLYNHFKDKNDLFAAVVTARCARFVQDVQDHVDPKIPVEQALRAIAAQFLDMIHDETALAVHRIVMFEWKQFPELGERFYDSGPRKTIALVADYLTAQNDRGVLSVPDADAAAALFFSMLKGDMHQRCLLGMHGPLSAAEKRQVIDLVVPVFLRGFGHTMV